VFLKLKKKLAQYHLIAIINMFKIIRASKRQTSKARLTRKDKAKKKIKKQMKTIFINVKY
jgi:hypothetical protein